MEQSALAQRFNEASGALDAKGHRIVVRKTRTLLEAGDIDGALDFLRAAGESMRDAEVSQLGDALRGWHEAGGQSTALVTDPTWVEGSANEQHMSRMIEHAVREGDVAQLADVLAEQQAALARQEPLPELVPGKGKLPPLPRGQAIGSVLPGDRRSPKAVVEAPSRLTEKRLGLDDTPLPDDDDDFEEDDAFAETIVQGPPGSGTPMAAQQPPQPREALQSPALADAAPPAPSVPTPEAPTPEGPAPDALAATLGPDDIDVSSLPKPAAAAVKKDESFAVPELDAPPSMPAAPKTPAANEGKGSLIPLLGLLLLLGAAAAAYFLELF